MQTKEVLPLVLATLITAGCQREEQLPQQTAEQAAPTPAETPAHQQENSTLELQALVNEKAKKLCGEYIGSFSIYIGPWEGEGDGAYKIIITHESCYSKMELPILNDAGNNNTETLRNLMKEVYSHIKNKHPECIGKEGQIARHWSEKPNFPPPLKPRQTRPYFNKT